MSSSVARSTSASSLYHKNQSTSSSLHKATSVYSLDRTSPQRLGSANLSLLSRSPFGSSGRPNLPSLPQRYPSATMVATEPLATDSSSDSSPTESPPIKNGRQTAPPRPFSLRNRNFSVSESLNSGEAKGLNSSEGLQKLRLKSRSEWDLKSSSQDDYSRPKDSCQSSRYLSYSPRKNYMKPLKLNHIGSSPSLSNVDSLRRSESGKDLASAEQLSLSSWDPSAVPCTFYFSVSMLPYYLLIYKCNIYVIDSAVTPELCESIADNLNRVTSFAMQVFQRVCLFSYYFSRYNINFEIIICICLFVIIGLSIPRLMVRISHY